ncbi:MAG: diacylglycerol kinase family protein [Ferruginibacter sp.]
MKLIRSFRYAWAGIRACFNSEPNFRIHLFAAIAAILFSLLFRVSAAEWLAVCFCIVLVITMEMMNTAIEKLCDVVHQELHPGIKNVKDIAAGAVLLSAFFSLLTAAVIFLPKIIMYLK